MKQNIRLFKAISVISLFCGAYWLSELGQPVRHCHDSSVLLAVIPAEEVAEVKVSTSWLGCSWWDHVLPRPFKPSRYEEESVLWSKQLRRLEDLKKLLPSPTDTVLVLRDEKNPFIYSVSERKVVLGSQVMASDNLLLRALLQAWLYQIDKVGLDTFQQEILADFLMLNFLKIDSYPHPITGFPVHLTERRFWPEEAQGFHDYCLSESASLQHQALCGEALSQKRSSRSPATLWSARLFALNVLSKKWGELKQEAAWRSLSTLGERLKTPRSEKDVPESIAEAQDMDSLLATELEDLVQLFDLDSLGDFIDKKISYLIDWDGGELSEDFLMSTAFNDLGTKASERIWLKYKGKMWDLRGRRLLSYETSGYTFRNVIRVQCRAGTLNKSAYMQAEELVLIQHCQGQERDWNLLFQGKLKNFLKQQTDMAYLILNPKELKRFLKWNTGQGSVLWEAPWPIWIREQGWEAIKDYRLSSSES